jgi:hypothetical protein
MGELLDTVDRLQAKRQATRRVEYETLAPEVARPY